MNGKTFAEGKHTVCLLVEDKMGVLQRIAGVFTKRGFNIDTLTVGRCETPGMSRMTITIKGDAAVAEKVEKQLNKLVDIIKVVELTPDNSVGREICLIKVHVRDATMRTEIINFTEVFRGKIVDVAEKSMIVEITGDSDKVNAFVELMRGFGIKELVRTGVAAISR